MIGKNILAAFVCLGIAGFTILGTTIAGTEPNSGPKGKESAKAPVWSRMESTTSSDLRGIWGTSSTNIYAVGYDHTKAGGVILHFDGECWSRIEGGADNYLHAIWGTDKNNIYAVGYRPYDVAFIKFDGSSWQRVIPQRRVIFLHGIGGTSSSNFHAIGYTQGSGGFIMKGAKQFDSARLPKIKPKHTILRGIWCVKKDAFVVGSGGVILYCKGTAWKQMKSPTKRTLQGIWGPTDAIFSPWARKEQSSALMDAPGEAKKVVPPRSSALFGVKMKKMSLRSVREAPLFISMEANGRPCPAGLPLFSKVSGATLIQVMSLR